MRQINKAAEAAAVLEMFGSAVHVAWTPGDATLYRLTLLKTRPHEPNPFDLDRRALLVEINGTDKLGPLVELVVEPAGVGHQRYDPMLWLETGHRPGWWPGIRPLLGALGWAQPGYDSVDFRAADHQGITEALRFRGEL